MKPKDLKQSERTKNFILVVKNLKKSGVVKSYNEIITALEWDKTSFSNVMHGRQNIPDWRYAKFEKVYGVEINNPQQMNAEGMLQVNAMCHVILSTQAEMLAHLKGLPVAKVLKELEGMASEQLLKLMGKQ